MHIVRQKVHTLYMPHYHTTATHITIAAAMKCAAVASISELYTNTAHTNWVSKAKRGQYCTQTTPKCTLVSMYTHLRNDGYSFDSSKNSGNYFLAFASFVLTFWICL